MRDKLNDSITDFYVFICGCSQQSLESSNVFINYTYTDLLLNAPNFKMIST